VIVATGMNGLLGLVFWAETTHALSVSTVGSASAVLAAMTFASTMAMMGLGTTALQILPRADDETWSTAVNSLVIGGATIGLVAGLIAAVVLPHVSSRLSFAGQPQVAICVALGTSVLTVATLLDYVFTAERRAHYVVIRGATFGLLKVALLSVLLLLGVRSGTWLIAAWVISSALTSGSTLLLQVRRLGRPHRYGVKGVPRYIRKWSRILILHHMTSLADVMIPSLMPVLVVTRLSTVASAQFYVAWLLSSVLLAVSAAVAGNLLAELSYNEEAMARTLRKAARLIASLLLPPVIVLAVFGRSILGIFGSTYATHSYGILLLFAVVALPDAVTNIYVSVLRVKGEPHKAAGMNLVMAAVALTAAWFLMGPFGVAGAAWAWALAQAVGCGYVAIDSHRAKRNGPVAPLSIGATRWVRDGWPPKGGEQQSARPTVTVADAHRGPTVGLVPTSTPVSGKR